MQPLALICYLHRDHLASVRLITNAAGQVEQSTSYTPYGDPQTYNSITTTTTPEEHSFIGERFDASSGLLYLNARYYDPALGRFLQPDWWEVRQPGVGTNRYTYSFNDPVNLSDRNGNQAEDEEPVCGFFCRLFSSGGDPVSGTGQMAIDKTAATFGQAFSGSDNSLIGCLLASGANCQNQYDENVNQARNDIDSERADQGISPVTIVLGSVVVGRQGPLLWTAARNGRLWRKGKLAQHFSNHGAEVGASSAREYQNMALEFSRRENSGEFIDVIGDTFTYRYSRETSEIFVGTNTGRIKTYYVWDGRQDDGVVNMMRNLGLLD